MINRTILVGRITKDPEVKAIGNNVSVCSFTLAVNRTFTDQSGERQADFIQCVAWRRQAELLGQYVKKGALLGVEGRIQTRTYEADGGTRYVTEVVCDSIQFLESRSSDDTQKQERPQTQYSKEPSPQDFDEDQPFFQAGNKKFDVNDDDDLPF